MYLIVIAWLYVALMMALAEAMHPTGSLLGAVVTFVLYGLAPAALVAYLMGTPARRRRAREREEASGEDGTSAQAQPDERGHAAGGAIAPEGEPPR